MAIPQVGAVGLVISVTITDQNQAPVDLSSTTTRMIYLRRPTGLVSRFVASLVGGGTTGQIAYATVAGDLDMPGEWRIQARLTTGTSTDYFSDVQPFHVAENIAP